MAHVSPLDGAYRSTLEAAQQMFLARGADAVHAAAQAEQMIYNLVQQQAAMLAFVEAFKFLAIAFLAVIPVVLLLKKTRPAKTEILAE